MYTQTGIYEEAGRQLDLHWQTVRANVRAWEERTRGGGGQPPIWGLRSVKKPVVSAFRLNHSEGVHTRALSPCPQWAM